MQFHYYIQILPPVFNSQTIFKNINQVTEHSLIFKVLVFLFEKITRTPLKHNGLQFTPRHFSTFSKENKIYPSHASF